MEYKQTMGKRISDLRKSKGMTQEQLAQQVGVTAQAVSKWENDLSCPDISILPQLAEALGYPKVSIIPNEYMLVSSAANNGQMAILEQPDSKFARFINQLADEIIGSKTHVRWG